MVNLDLKYAMSFLWSEVNSVAGKNGHQISFPAYPEKSADVLTKTSLNLPPRIDSYLLVGRSMFLTSMLPQPSELCYTHSLLKH
jgi:hypothetical protein